MDSGGDVLMKVQPVEGGSVHDRYSPWQGATGDSVSWHVLRRNGHAVGALP